MIDDFKDQSADRVLCAGMGNKVTIPVQEVDDTGRFCLRVQHRERRIQLTLTEKQ